MAVPSLIQKAGLTLFHNPHLQPEGVSIDYSDLGKFASVIQRAFFMGARVSGPINNRQRRISRRGILSRAATRINALFRAFSVRCYFVGFDPSRIFTPPLWPPAPVGTRRLRMARRSARVFLDGEAWLNMPNLNPNPNLTMNPYDYENRLRY